MGLGLNRMVKSQIEARATKELLPFVYGQINPMRFETPLAVFTI